MYSWILRFIYSFTYYIHLGIVGELYQINKYGWTPSFSLEQTLWDKVLELLQIHYPILLFILCLFVANFMLKGVKKTASFTVKMKASEPFGVEILYTGVQIIPYLSFIFKEQFFGFWGASVLVLVTVLFLTWHGVFNLSLLFWGYHQYRIKTENDTIWLISKRKISNFSNSEIVHTLQDNVYVRHE